MKKAAHIKHRQHMPAFKRIILSNADGDHFIDPDDIISIEACGNQSYFHTLRQKPQYRKIIISKTLKEVEETYRLTGFIRTHRSWIANLRHVLLRTKSKDGLPVLLMSSETEVPIADDCLPRVKQALTRFVTLVN